MVIAEDEDEELEEGLEEGGENSVEATDVDATTEEE